MPKVQLPQIVYRDYQRPVIEALKAGCKRLVCKWHRRAGKDVTFLNVMVARSALRRKGLYAMVYPYLNQGRKILWQGQDDSGKKFMDYIPSECIANKNEQEMRIEFKWGSAFQIYGADNIDALRGGNPVFIGFSEYAYMNPDSWRVMAPVVEANDGIVAFLSTPNGPNHFAQMGVYAEAHQPEWFYQKLTIDQTHKEDGSPIIDEAKLEEQRALGFSDEWINREYYCSTEGSLEGSYYGRLIAAAEREGRIGDFPADKSARTVTGWDIGVGDLTVIWFVQPEGEWLNLVDYYENCNEGSSHYTDLVKEKGYRYVWHYLPHDARNREKGSGKSFEDYLRGDDVKPIEIVPAESPETGINATRSIFPKLRFNLKTTYIGLDRLRNYVKKYNRSMQCFMDEPLHDINSHGADGLKIFALGFTKLNSERTLPAPPGSFEDWRRGAIEARRRMTGGNRPVAGNLSI